MNKDALVDTEETKRIIRTFFKNLYSTKLENLKQMDDYPEGKRVTRYHSWPGCCLQMIVPGERKNQFSSIW